MSIPCGREHPSLVRMQSILMTAMTYAVLEEERAAVPGPQEADWMEPVPAGQDQPVAFTVSAEPQPVSPGWKRGFEQVLQGLLEPQAGGDASASAGEETPEAEAFSDTVREVAQEAPLSSYTPFRWEPEPAWISAPAPSVPPWVNKADPTRFAPRPKIPRRPLHKSPFYRRFLFYLRRWLSKSP
jgi:hypothetical protein